MGQHHPSLACIIPPPPPQYISCPLALTLPCSRFRLHQQKRERPPSASSSLQLRLFSISLVSKSFLSRTKRRREKENVWGRTKAEDIVLFAREWLPVLTPKGPDIKTRFSWNLPLSEVLYVWYLNSNGYTLQRESWSLHTVTVFKTLVTPFFSYLSYTEAERIRDGFYFTWYHNPTWSMLHRVHVTKL